MASITITIPDAEVNRVTDAFRYDPAGGETRAAFMKRLIIDHIKATVRNREQQLAAEAAAATVAAPPVVS